jgi:hypothetical protein
MSVTTSFKSSEVPLDAYLVRPQLMEGESLKGYIYRFYSNNGTEVPNTIWRLIFELYKHDNPEESLVKRLHNIIRQTNAMAEYNWLKDHHLLDYINIKNQHFLNTSQCRFCPKCLNETDLHWALWNVPMFTVCLKHECQLINRCPDCHASFKWRALRFNWHCFCNSDVKKMEASPATPIRLKVAQIIFNANDSPLCTQYQKNILLNQSNNYSLQALFSALEWAHFFKVKVKLVKYKHIYKNKLILLQKISAGKYGYWESKLLFQGITTKKIERILKRVSTKNITINTIFVDLKLLTVITTERFFLENNNNIFTESLIPPFQEFIKQYSVQIENDVALWVNQSNIDSNKQFTLDGYRSWWLSVVPEGNSQSDLEWQSKKFHRNKKSIEITINIVKKLVYASQFPKSYYIYKKYLKSWSFPSTVLICTQSDYPLNQIIVYLSRLGNHALLSLYKQIEGADFELRQIQNV